MAKKFLTDINIAGGVYDSSGDIGNSGQVLSSTGSGVNWINATSSASIIYQDGFTGNGSTTAFTLANSLDNENKTQVYIDGVYQHKDNYSLSGTTLTFSTAPPNSSDIEVISFSSVSAADDILYDDDFTSAGLMTTNGSGVYSITTNNSSNWNTAYTHSQAAHAPANAEQNVQSDWTATSGDSFIQNKPTIPSGNQIIDWTADQGSTEIHSGNYINTTYTVGDGGLTQNNFTNALKTKLDGIEASADVTDTANVTAAGALMDSELTDLAGVKAVTISDLATETYVDTAVSDLVDSSPATLNTLNELAAALGDDANFSTTVTNSIATKLPLAGGTLTGNLTLDDGAGASPSIIFKNANDETWAIDNGSQGVLNFTEGTDDRFRLLQGGNAIFAGAVTIEYDGDALNLRSITNAVNTRITFSSDVPAVQIGHIEYTHSNSASYGSGDAFIIGGTESTTTILADGKLMYNEGIYSKPASGTGAGTRKDSNWDTAYTYSQVGHLPLAGGTITSGTNIGLTINHDTFEKGLVIHRNHATNAASIVFKNNTGMIGTLLAISSDNQPYWQEAAGTDSYKIWHENNDGSGSGLDADLLDGLHASSFLQTTGSFGDFTGVNTALNSRTGTGVAIGNYTSAYSYIDLASTNSSFGSWIDFSKGDGADYAGRIRYHNSNETFTFTTGGSNNEFVIYTTYTYSPGSSRSPIFYDSDNTGFYLNPNNISQLRHLRLKTAGDLDLYVSDNDAWVHGDARDEGSVAALYKYTRSTTTGYGAYKEYWYDGSNYQSIICHNNTFKFSGPVSTTDGNLTINALDGGSAPAMTSQFTMKGYEGRGIGIKMKDSVHSASGSSDREWFVGSGYNTANFNIGYSASGSQSSYAAQSKLIVSTGGDVTGVTSLRSPIFYDSNDTAYYTNPAGESKIVKLWINNGGAGGVSWSTGLNMGSGSNYWNLIQDVGIARQRNFGTGGYDWFSSSAAQLMTLSNGGTLFASADMRSPVFYDSTDTNYYIHPNDASYLSGLTVQYGNMDLRYARTVDMTGSGYNQSTYYPVRIYVSDITRIRIENRLNAGGTHPGWASHGSGFSLLMDWYTNGSGWGTVGVSRTLRQWNEAWANVTICGGITQMSHSSAEVVWLRGGGKYLVKTSFNNTVQVQTSAYTANSQTVTPTTSIVNDVYSSASGNFSAGNIYSNNFYDAADPGYLLSPANTGVSLKVKGTAEFVTAAGNLRGYIRATDTNDSHFVIATSGGEDIAFKDGGTSGGVNMVIRGDGDVIITRNLYTRSFYDQDNTGYYVDPASTSNMNAATFAGNVIGQNAYFNQDVGIGFTSGNIGGNLNIRNSAAGQIAAKIELGSSVNSSSTGVFVNTTASYASSGMFLHFQSNHISGDDNVLIAYLDGDIVNKNNSYTQYSDQRLKENIVDATSKLEEIKQIRVRNFNFIGEDLKQIGVVAQELEPIFPSLVKEREVPGHDDPIKTVKYSVMVPILIKAIQELSQEVQTLKDQINGIN